MAIVEMKKIALLGLSKDKQRVLRCLQRMGCVEITENPDGEAVPDEREEKRLAALNKRLARLDLAVARLSPHDPNKPGMLSVRPEAGADQVAGALAAEGDIMAAVARLEEIERTRGELRAREAREHALLEQLTPWQSLSAPLDELRATKSAEVFLLSVPSKNWDAFAAGVAGLAAVALEQVSVGREGVNAMLALHTSEMAAAEELMQGAGATRVSFEGLSGTVPLVMDQIGDRIARIAEVRVKLTAETKKLAEQLPMMRLLRDLTVAERDRLASASRCLNTRSAFYLTGWATADSKGPVEEALKKLAPECEVEYTDPLDGETPPTLLRNKTAVRPFESIVKMYSMPDPNGLDPTFVMMPFWICFFGMMVSDAGYGIILGALASYVYVKLKGRGIGQMAFILALGGLSTVFWGAMYGGWFSIPNIQPILLSPMDEPISMLLLCMGVGALHLFTGLGVAAYMNIRRGQYLNALYDQGFWMILLIGLGLTILIGTPGLVMAAIGALGIVLFAGRGKPNFLKRIVSGLGSLYGISGYVSDLLSYARLFGMGLATGVIGMVFNTLAGMLMGSPVGTVFAVVVLLVGHTFNLFINALGAYVHSCRLQFIEFFGKFYEMGGRGFRPLTVNTRYVDIRGEEF